ncbi:unnamed protein product, partial [Brassica oleracea]
MALPLVSSVSYIKSSNQFHLLVISQKYFLKFSLVFSRENSISALIPKIFLPGLISKL